MSELKRRSPVGMPEIKSTDGWLNVLFKSALLLIVDLIASVLWVAISANVNRTPRFRPEYPESFADWWIINGPLLILIITFFVSAWFLRSQRKILAGVVGFSPAIAIFLYYFVFLLPLTYFNRHF